MKVAAEDQDRLDRSRRVGWLDLDRISTSRIMVAGAGALGNEVAKDLALSGFKRITMVDMDHVVKSNLNRCMFFTERDAERKRKKAKVVAEGVRRLSPGSQVTPVVERLEDLPERVYREHDMFLGCLDNVSARLHLNAHAYVNGKMYIDGGMDGFVGRVMVTRPPKGACLQCGMNKSHAKIASLRFSCTGKDVVFHEPHLAAEITTTSVISAVMVREALKALSGKADTLISNCFYYDGLRNVSEEMEIPLNPECPLHALPRRRYR